MTPRPIRVLRARARWAAARARHLLDVRAGSRLEARLELAPIFVLGAPRSGTTLLYQLLVEGLDVAWLANAHAARPAGVVAVERSAPPLEQRLGSDFDSAHGATSGGWGPSEAGEFWYRAFPRERHQQGIDDATPARVREVAAMVRRFTAAAGRPVVFKNTLNSLRVPVLATALPEARFILIERDLPDNARSLLVGRLRRGDANAWWSARPDGADELAGRPAAEQVTWQARTVVDVARHDLAAHAPGRSTTVTYDELCRDPHAVLRGLHRWLAGAGIPVALRDPSRIPERFDRRGGGTLPADHEAALARALGSTGASSDPSREDGAR